MKFLIAISDRSGGHAAVPLLSGCNRKKTQGECNEKHELFLDHRHAAQNSPRQGDIGRNRRTVKELMEQDRELRKKLQQEREVASQRRDFLKTAGGLGLGASLMPLATHAAPGSQPDIAIVGAGGLRTAHRLQQYGIDSTIYEANTRVGGRMYSDRSFFSDDRVVEWQFTGTHTLHGKFTGTHTLQKI